jgi:hypothetical protein
MAHSKALIIGGFVRGPSTGGVESLCDEVVGRKPRRRCRPQNTTGPRQLLVSADRRHGRQRRQAPPPDLHNSELEDAGYESAACCLSDELGACVVQLQNPLRHRERSRPTNFLERSLGEVRQRRPRFAADERVSGETIARPVQPLRLASARSDAHRLRSAMGQAGESGDDLSCEDRTPSTCRDVWCRLHRLYICVRDPAGRLATTTKGKS